MPKTNNNKMAEKEDVIILDRYDISLLPENFLENYFTQILCHKGQGQFQLEGKTYTIQPNDIATWLVSAKVENLLLSPDFEADIILSSYDIVTKNNPNILWGIKWYLFIQENPILHLSETDKAKCKHYLEELKSINNDTNHRFRQEILNCQVQIFIMSMWNIYAQKIEEKLNFEGRRVSLFERFLNLVEAHCMQEREVGFYSDNLYVSAKYLSEVCKKNSGKTASEWIQNYTVQRLVLLLKNPNLTLTEIADMLNFSSQSFFSRYVRNALGVSPSEYRQRLR